MQVTDFARAWFFDAGKPHLANYPSVLDDEAEIPKLEASLEDIGEYQRRLWANRSEAVLLVVHGPDASGKDSLIRTLATFVDPAGFHAWSFGRPDGAETRHDFLWRVARKVPELGEMVAFNRSHHEAVIGERLWPVHPPERYSWPNRYRSIRDFERHLVDEGTTIIKVWLNLSEEEHRRRLLTRLDKPRKRWKFDQSDVSGWKKRAEYAAFAEQALANTHTEFAPWFIVPADRKPQARAIVAKLLAEQLQRLAPDYPEDDKAVLREYRRLLADEGVK